MTAYVETEAGDLVNTANIESLIIDDAPLAVVIVCVSGSRYTYSTMVLDHDQALDVRGRLYGMILGDDEARPLPAPTWEASQVLEG